MIAKNITFQNVTYDLDWFNTHNLTHNYENPNAAEMQIKRRQRVENYSLSLNNSVEAADQIYK